MSCIRKVVTNLRLIKEIDIQTCTKEDIPFTSTFPLMIVTTSSNLLSCCPSWLGWGASTIYPLILPFVSLCHVLSSMVDHGGVACCLVFCVCVIVEIEATMIVRCKSVMFDLTITNITYGDKERETSISIINLQL